MLWVYLGIKITKKISIKNLKENTSTIIDVPDKFLKETEMHNSLFQEINNLIYMLSNY